MTWTDALVLAGLVSAVVGWWLLLHRLIPNEVPDE